MRSQKGDICQLFIRRRTDMQVAQRIPGTEQQKSRGAIKKWVHNLDKNLSKEEIRITNKYSGVGSTS